MSRQNIAVGAAANDGTGDTLRAAGNKINANFVEIYQKLGGDSDTLSGQLSVAADGLLFEGTTTDSNETILKVRDPDSDRTIFLPNASGEVVLDSNSQTLKNKVLEATRANALQFDDASRDHQYIMSSGELTADRTISLPVLTTNDTFVFRDATQTLSNKTLDSATLNDATLAGQLQDINGSNLIQVTATASSVNDLGIANAATGSAPQITTKGSDTNVSLSIQPKGTGSVINKKVAISSNTQTAGGAVSTTAGYIIFNSGSAVAATLANGTETGEMKVLTNKGAGIATITIPAFGPGSTVALDQNDGVTLIWDAAKWQIVGEFGATVAQDKI